MMSTFEQLPPAYTGGQLPVMQAPAKDDNVRRDLEECTKLAPHMQLNVP